MSLNFTGIDVTATIDQAEDTCKLSPYLSTSQHIAHAEDKLIENLDQTERFAGGYTYQQIILVISAVATTLCLIFSVSLASVHMSNWVKPKEQKQ